MGVEQNSSEIHIAIPKADIESIFLQNMLQCDALVEEASDGKRGLQKPAAEVVIFSSPPPFFFFLSGQ